MFPRYSMYHCLENQMNTLHVTRLNPETSTQTTHLQWWICRVLFCWKRQYVESGGEWFYTPTSCHTKPYIHSVLHCLLHSHMNMFFSMYCVACGCGTLPFFHRFLISKFQNCIYNHKKTLDHTFCKVPALIFPAVGMEASAGLVRDKKSTNVLWGFNTVILVEGFFLPEFLILFWIFRWHFNRLSLSIFGWGSTFFCDMLGLGSTTSCGKKMVELACFFRNLVTWHGFSIKLIYM